MAGSPFYLAWYNNPRANWANWLWEWPTTDNTTKIKNKKNHQASLANHSRHLQARSGHLTTKSCWDGQISSPAGASGQNDLLDPATLQLPVAYIFFLFYDRMVKMNTGQEILPSPGSNNLFSHYYHTTYPQMTGLLDINIKTFSLTNYIEKKNSLS